jgi:hypothetical protein
VLLTSTLGPRAARAFYIEPGDRFPYLDAAGFLRFEVRGDRDRDVDLAAFVSLLPIVENRILTIRETGHCCAVTVTRASSAFWGDASQVGAASSENVNSAPG